MRPVFFLYLFFLSSFLHAQSCNDAYGLFSDDNFNVYLVSYNTLTGEQTKVHDFGQLIFRSNSQKKGFYNDSLKTYYCFADEGTAYTTQLISIDVITGHIKNSMSLGTVFYLDYDPTNGKLYGIRSNSYNYMHYYEELICIDPEAQTVTTLGSMTTFTYFGNNSLVIDPVQKRLYMWSYKELYSTFTPVLLVFDLENGTLISDAAITEAFTHIHYNKKDGKCYGLNFDTSGKKWYSLFDTGTSSIQHIIEITLDQYPWFANNAMINLEKDRFLYYGTNMESVNYLFSLDLATGELVDSLEQTEGIIAMSGVRMGSVWHPSGCTTPLPPHPNPVIQVPNLFTPNSDGTNDTFEIESLPLGQASLTIYNAWGALVYSSSAYANNWKAEHNEDGVYYYTLTTLYDQKEYQGWVQVLR